jgi:hypothetical protein
VHILLCSAFSSEISLVTVEIMLPLCTSDLKPCSLQQLHMLPAIQQQQRHTIGWTEHDACVAVLLQSSTYASHGCQKTSTGLQDPNSAAKLQPCKHMLKTCMLIQQASQQVLAVWVSTTIPAMQEQLAQPSTVDRCHGTHVEHNSSLFSTCVYTECCH